MNATNSTMVSMEWVNKRYPNFSLENFNLQVESGEILGLVGPNGAGKSTCLRLLMGFIQADSGRIQVMGKSMPEHCVAIKQEVAYISEEMRLYADETIEWHMNFVRQFYPGWDAKFAAHIVKKFDLNKKQNVKSLSLGQRIKSTLLLALARRPKLLVLDEPSTGLDPVARFELTQALLEIMLDEEASVVFSSQFTQDVERLSDRIAFIDNGLLVSCQDKESYIDSWKMLEIKGPELPSVPGIISVFSGLGVFNVIHEGYNEEVRQRYQQAGCEVVQVYPMTLEEIFIRKILSRRSESGVENVA